MPTCTTAGHWTTTSSCWPNAASSARLAARGDTVVEVRCDPSELDPVSRAWSALAQDVHVGWVSGPQARGTRVLHVELTPALGFAEAVRSWPALADRLAHRAWPRAGHAVLVVTTASELLLDAPRVELATFVRAVQDAASPGAERLTVVLQTALDPRVLVQRTFDAASDDDAVAAIESAIGVAPVAVPGGAGYVVRLRVPPHLLADTERRLDLVLRLLGGEG